MKSFEWVESTHNNVVVRVKMTGKLSFHYTRLDLASRGLVTNSESQYVQPDGKVFHFSQ